MRKSVLREIDDDIHDHVLEIAYQHLRDGAQGEGEYLTRRECEVLLETLTRLPKRNSKPKKPKRVRFNNWFAIAVYSNFEHLGPVEAAVAATMEKYHVSRGTVFAARERFDEYKQLLADKLADKSPTHSAK
jgi:hypothetical protein